MASRALTGWPVDGSLCRVDESTRFRAFLETKLPEALRVLEKMVGINSFTANPHGVNRLGQYTAELFGGLGFKPEFVPSSNPLWGRHLVLVRPGKSKSTIAMVSHLDTVFPPEEEQRNDFRWQVEGDRIYGPGTHDIKGGTVMMWLMLGCLQACKPELSDSITWKLFLNSSEECFSPDFRDVCLNRLGPHTLAALVFEAEGRKRGQTLLVVGRKGRGSWRLTARGRGAHAGGNHAAGANAVVQLAAAIQKIAALTDYKQGLTVNVATVNGGTVLNRVPHQAFAEGEFRAFSPEVFEKVKAALLALNGQGEVASHDGYHCSLEVEILTESRPWPRNPNSDRLLEVWRSAAAELGRVIGPQERGGLSDGNLLWDAVPTLDGLGPWGENDHCSERSPDGSKIPEFVEISSLVPKALLNCVAICRLALKASP